MKTIETVWIIDDDPASTYVATRTLKKEGELQNVVSFNQVTEAYQAIKEHAQGNTLPDVVLLDINMPVLNGFELLQELEKENISFGRTKIYMLTSSSHPVDRAKAITSSTPIAGYITKPLTKEKIDQLISKQ
ncbi:response regulator [Adhaeribacter aquaticus]|uniref:response regulator n=1 Tax=Adhaeribacter aquaticus TaxID=299567 RepID=UPI0004296B24|nr:response regulator [Adhaeribacter aquaticus]